MPAVHPTTGKTISSYKKLAIDDITHDVWIMAFGEEFGNLTKGDGKTETASTDSIFVMTVSTLKNIPKDSIVTYVQIVVECHSQKKIKIKST